MGEIIFLLVFEFFGPVIVLGLIAWGVVVFFRGRRLKKSVSASRGDAAAMALEGLRIRATVISYLAILLGVAAFCLTLMADGPFSAACMAGGFAYAVPVLWSRSLRSRYNKEFKGTIVAAELSRVFTNLEYLPTEKFDANALQELGFFVPFNELGGSDLIMAEYKGIRFTQSDISLARTGTTRDDDGKEREYSSVFFNGRAMRFDFTDAFKGDVQVVKRNFGQARVTQPQGEWQSLETELAEFGEDYRIFAKDPVAAMTVLTPQMIEGIYYLDKTLRVPLALHFTGRSMFVFMALARDAFETSKKKTLLEEREFLEKDIALITGFLETMYFKERAVTPLSEAEPQSVGDGAGDGAGLAVPLPASSPPASSKDARRELPLSGARDSLQRMGYKVSGLGKWLGAVAFYTPVSVYLASAVYTLWAFPDGFSLSYSSSGGNVTLGEDVSTLMYVLVASIFILPVTLAAGGILKKVLVDLLAGGNSGFSLGGRIGGGIKSVVMLAMWLLPFWIHLFFLNANMLYR